MISLITPYFRIALASVAFAVAASAPVLVFAETAEQLFVQQKLSPQPGQCLDVAVDLTNSLGFSQAQVADTTELRYRMAFNNVAEGWSWHEGAASLDEDYYQFKFLPLQSVLEERGEYRGEDKIGVEQTMRRTWRYDYFLAFENLYDFYPRKIDDDAGFVANFAKGWSGQVGMRAHACLVDPVVSESTTFWKATYAKPTDFTLKKRYLMSTLKSVTFFDPQTGRVLAVIKP
ncbi:MAG: hypothetical protein RIR18_849 [Pseudomonadota bacterium]